MEIIKRAPIVDDISNFRHSEVSLDKFTTYTKLVH